MAGPIIVTLDEEVHKLWHQFHTHMAEMIVVKERGRKLFPRLEYRVRGLQPDCSYVPVLVFRRVDDNRYKYSCGEWQMNGKGDAPIPEQPQVHQGGVVSGKQLMENKINFDYLRITNNTQHGHMVILQSMHKYTAILSIYQIVEPLPLGFHPQYTDLRTSARVVCIFEPEYTRFMAVTAYFNEKIKKLKIDKNKYAKGHKNEKYGSKIKSCNSPSPNPGSAYTTPTTSPESENSHLTAMRGMPYVSPSPMPAPMWNPEFYNPYFFQQYQFSDVFQYPYSLLNMPSNGYDLNPS